MSTKSQLSPISMGAIGLTMGMSLVSPAEASIIAGDTTYGKTVTDTTRTVDYNNGEDNSGGFERDGISRLNRHQEDIFKFDLTTGEVHTGEDTYNPDSLQFSIHDYYDHEEYADRTGNSYKGYSYQKLDTFYGGYINTYSDRIRFSKSNCTDVGYSGLGSGEDLYLDPTFAPFGEDCLSNLATGTLIDKSWFDGTNGNASQFGFAYLDGLRSEYNETAQAYTYRETLVMSNWDMAETGFVAFVFNNEVGYSEYSSNPINTDGVPSWYDLESTKYGYLEITRGSISVNSVVVAQAAPAVNVSEPTGLALFSLGLFGLFARKFKKSAN